MVFKFVLVAPNPWQRLEGQNQLPKLLEGARFQNGVEVIKIPVDRAA